MQAVILIENIENSMKKIENKPFIEHLINSLKNEGVKKFLLINNIYQITLENHFKNFPNISFSSKLEFNDLLENEFLLLKDNGFFDIQYSLLSDFAQNKNAKALLALKYSTLNENLIKIDKDYKVTCINSQNDENVIDGYINAEIYYFKKEILQKYSDDLNIEKIINDLTQKNELHGLPVGGKFFNIEQNLSLLPALLDQQRKPALFLDRDGIIVEDTGYVHGTNLLFIDKAFDTVKEALNKNHYVIVITNQSGVAKGFYTEEEMHQTNAYIEKIYVEKGLKYDKFYNCPYHEKGKLPEYTKKTLLRKPEPAMILLACEDYRIDMKNSLMIGNNHKTDIINLPYLKSIIDETYEVGKVIEVK